MDIIEIANNADGRKKLSKAKLWLVVRGLIYSGDDRMIDDLADLYNYFKPAPRKTPKTPEEWVARAMPTNDIRYYLNYVYSDGGRIMATDGHRLHVFETDKYPKGFYDGQMNPLEVGATYPDITRVIPKGRGKSMQKKELLSGEIKINEADSSKAPAEVIGINHGFAQRKYIDDALSFFDEAGINTFQADYRNAIRYRQGHLMAVVMPIRM